MHPQVKQHLKHYFDNQYGFQDKADYYIFSSFEYTAGNLVYLAIDLPRTSDSHEAHLFTRLRNACFLSQNNLLVGVLYRNIKDIIAGWHEREDKKQADEFFEEQIRYEFPAFNPATMQCSFEDYDFTADFESVREFVRLLELNNPILRAWMREDPADGLLPEDPAARYVGEYWKQNLRSAQEERIFIAGDLAEWGPGWVGQVEEK